MRTHLGKNLLLNRRDYRIILIEREPHELTYERICTYELKGERSNYIKNCNMPKKKNIKRDIFPYVP